MKNQFLLLLFLPVLLLIGWEKEPFKNADSEFYCQAEAMASSIDLFLLPVDGNYQTLTIADMLPGLADDYSGDLNSAEIVIDLVISDELEDDPGPEDGNTTDDIIIAPDCQSVQLRKEFMSGGNGRVYVIWLKITDDEGQHGAWFWAGVPSSHIFNTYVASFDVQDASYAVFGCAPCGGWFLPSVSVSPPNGSSYNLDVWGFSLPLKSLRWGVADNPPRQLIDSIDGTSRWDGAANTQKIVAKLGSQDFEYAAKFCAELNYGNCDDWYLPATEELRAVHQQMGAIGNTNYTTLGYGIYSGFQGLFDESTQNSYGLRYQDYGGAYFWSSTEQSYQKVWGWRFDNDGAETANAKSGWSDCLCVRKQ